VITIQILYLIYFHYQKYRYIHLSSNYYYFKHKAKKFFIFYKNRFPLNFIFVSKFLEIINYFMKFMKRIHFYYLADLIVQIQISLEIISLPPIPS